MITFSQKVLEYKNSFRSLPEVINETNSFFDENYFPGAKIKTKFNTPFVPGQIYSFAYKTPSLLSKTRKFINRNPVVLCIDSFQNKEMGLIMKGIDLITVPPDIRVIILERIYDKFFSLIESGSKPIPVTEDNLKNLLSDTGFDKSMFGFKTTYFGEIYRIVPEDWYKIPYLSKSFIEGMNLQGIYSLYKSK
jgi:hypothetical protein